MKSCRCRGEPAWLEDGMCADCGGTTPLSEAYGVVTDLRAKLAEAEVALGEHRRCYDCTAGCLNAVEAGATISTSGCINCDTEALIAERDEHKALAERLAATVESCRERALDGQDIMDQLDGVEADAILARIRAEVVEECAKVCDERSERAMVIYRSMEQRIERGDPAVSLDVSMSTLDESTTAVNLAAAIRALADEGEGGSDD